MGLLNVLKKWFTHTEESNLSEDLLRAKKIYEYSSLYGVHLASQYYGCSTSTIRRQIRKWKMYIANENSKNEELH